MSKRALITGITGQDGSYLARFLLDKGYEVFGTYRRVSTPNFWRLQYLNVFKKVRLISVDIIDTSSVFEAVKACEPDEIYHLASQSFVPTSFEQPVSTGDITGLGVSRILEAIRKTDPKIRFYQASTSELYGLVDREQRIEDTPFHPVSPYAAAKLYSYWMTRIYRDAYGMFACNGICFNHESPLRGLEFVTRKITNTVAQIALGLEKELRLGNLSAARDWGFSPEYCEAMWLMLQQEKPDDYVVATDESHTVEEFVERAFKVVNLDWREYVQVDERLLRPTDINLLRGDYSKAREKLGWQPQVKFEQLVEIMVQEDVSRWERCLRGESFPWDAANYPNESSILSRRTT